ncbi:PREDICTED: uncharacterized protein LOC109185196 [Ipomoea nil]|uniref:uncharacterized protein LOC109185196 n=1 Tax=Ipomoea nil TaxID=35883 RepID=UPI0009009922|nr:PREDICTED: uncharacterized protein LOC109185196 [Ipomoea nil]
MASTWRQSKTLEPSSHESLIQNLQQLAQVAQTLSNTILHNNDRSSPPNENSEVDRQISKHQPPFFSREEDPTILEEWIRTFDKIFEIVECPKKRQVEVVSFYLKHAADLWWVHEGPAYKQELGFNWEFLKARLREQFYPTHIRAAKYKEFLHLRQGTATITEYHKQFLKLARLTPELVPTESTKIEKFVPGLNFESRKTLTLHKPRTLEEAYANAAKLQQIPYNPPEIPKGHKRKIVENNATPLQKSKTARANPPKEAIASVPTKKTGATQGKILTMSRARIGDNNIVTGTFLIHTTPAIVLFDSGVANSFIATEFATQLDLTTNTRVQLQVKVASGEVIKCDRMYKNIMITIEGIEFPSNLIQFRLDGIQVILGMDWLGKFQAQILCGEQKVVLRGPNGKRVSYHGSHKNPEVKLVNMMKMRKYMTKGHEAFLCSIEDLSTKTVGPRTIPVVNEFTDVFLDEIPGAPPPWEVEFTIDLMPGAALISKPPYRLAPKEMKELKTELQDLLDKGYIRPSTSPWGAPQLLEGYSGLVIDSLGGLNRGELLLTYEEGGPMLERRPRKESAANNNVGALGVLEVIVEDEDAVCMRFGANGTSVMEQFSAFKQLGYVDDFTDRFE